MGWIQALAFLLAAAAVVGNDSLQTLGPFLSSNRGRVPLPLQVLFLGGLLAVMLGVGWWLHGGDPSWGRLAAFPLPQVFRWVDLLPPLAVLGLTRWGAPLSTSLLLLTAVVPAQLGPVLRKSLLGYGLAAAAGLLLYGLLLWLLERPRSESVGAPAGLSDPDAPFWLVLQWAATAWLWSQWLVQDLANVYVLLPRQLSAAQLGLSGAVLCLGLAGLVASGGGPIQRVVQTKLNTGRLRSATLIDLLFGALLLVMARLSATPLSTTWVFLGLLAGRELGLWLRLQHRPVGELAAVLGQDLAKASVALGLSLALALLLQPFRSL